MTLTPLSPPPHTPLPPCKESAPVPPFILLYFILFFSLPVRNGPLAVELKFKENTVFWGGSYSCRSLSAFHLIFVWSIYFVLYCLSVNPTLFCLSAQRNMILYLWLKSLLACRGFFAARFLEFTRSFAFPYRLACLCSREKLGRKQANLCECQWLKQLHKYWKSCWKNTSASTNSWQL